MFVILRDIIKVQLGAVITHDNKPIVFCSRKLNPAQINYTTIEREIFCISETFKELRKFVEQGLKGCANL